MGDGPIKMSLDDWVYYWQDRVTYWIVWRLMPRYVAYHAFSRVWTAAEESRQTEGYEGLDPMSCEEAMRRWEGESPYAP